MRFWESSAVVPLVVHEPTTGALGRLYSSDPAQIVWCLTELEDLGTVRSRARRLLEIHPLRTADALQLAAALVAVNDRPEGFGLVTLDSRLAEAAEREGFDVVGATTS